MKDHLVIKRIPLLCALLALCALPLYAEAQPLDDVSLEYKEQGVVATIRLTGPVQYLSHFPASHGKTLEIFYERIPGATSDEVWMDNEVRKSPPSGLIPGFTVTSRDQQTKPRLVIEFSREAEYSVAAGKDNRSLLITIHPEKRPVSTGPLPFLPTVKPEVAAVAGLALSENEAAIAATNKEARALMVQGRDALAAKNQEAAVDAFNKLLLLPPNDFTQDGQEWVGVARERAAQNDKARIEYELYLRLYPEGEGAAHVAQRLAGLAGGGGAAGAGSAEERKRAARWMSFGSLSSRYYYGKSTMESTQIYNNAPETLKTTLTDQSMLITSMDASERYVSEDYDGRLVFRDTNTRNMLNNKPSINRISAAYGEIKDRKLDYLVRVGRQSSMGGGVLGRFDGVTGAYGDAQSLRVNGVVGQMADYSQGTQPTFVGAKADSGAFSFYGINQNIGSVLDRRAVGTEFRYFEGKQSAFGLLDYDTYFKALNAAQMMGTTEGLGGTVHLMVDRRKTPSLSIRNATYGATVTNVDALLQTMSVSSLRELALARTATSNMGQVGLSVPFAEKWQAGGDFRLSNTTGLPASGTQVAVGTAPSPDGFLAAIPSRGTERGVTGQIIGSGLRKVGDIWSGSITFNKSSTVNGYSTYFYQHTPFRSGWTMDTTLQMYKQKDQYGNTTTVITPMLRGAYRFREQFTFDVDGGLQSIKFDMAQPSTFIQSKNTRAFFSAGLRWDF